MPFNPELIKVFKSSGKYMNLVHGSSTITFALKECYSHFGVTYNKKFKNYSIGVNVDDKLFSKLKAVESKAESFLERSLSKLLLRCLVERSGYRSLYLKLKPDQFEDEMLNEPSVLVSGIITVTAIYTDTEHPPLLVRVDEMEIKKAPPRAKPKVEVLSDDDECKKIEKKVL